MTYAKVINGEIIEHNRTLPFATETTMFGVNATPEELSAEGYYPVIGSEPAYDIALQRVDGVAYAYDDVLQQVTKTYHVVDIPQVELIDKAIKLAEAMADATIQAKIEAYNTANGLAFKNIDAFPKYAINTNSTHYAVANQFIAYAANIWLALRNYQATLTGTPTEAEIQSVLDSVVL